MKNKLTLALLFALSAGAWSCFGTAKAQATPEWIEVVPGPRGLSKFYDEDTGITCYSTTSSAGGVALQCVP